MGAIYSLNQLRQTTIAKGHMRGGMFFMLILFFSQGKILSEKNKHIMETSCKQTQVHSKKKQIEKRQEKRGKGKVKLKEIKLECDKIAKCLGVGI